MHGDLYLASGPHSPSGSLFPLCFYVPVYILQLAAGGNGLADERERNSSRQKKRKLQLEASRRANRHEPLRTCAVTSHPTQYNKVKHQMLNVAGRVILLVMPTHIVFYHSEDTYRARVAVVDVDAPLAAEAALVRR